MRRLHLAAGVPLAATAAAALALLFLQAGPAVAEWRVVGPGIAAGSAKEGRASLIVECGEDLVLAVYGHEGVSLDGGTITLSVDGRVFEVEASGDAKRMTLTESGRESGISPELRRLLAEGRRVELSSGALSGLPRDQRTFSLLGSRKAIATVMGACGG